MNVSLPDRFRPIRALLLTGTASALFLLPLSGQEPRLESREIRVSGSGSALSIERTGVPGLEVRLSDESLSINGRTVAEVTPDGELVRGWGRLLREIGDRDDAGFLRALADWSPPPGLTGGDSLAAAELDRALEEFAATGSLPGFETAPGASRPAGDRTEGVLERLLEDPGLFAAIGRAVGEFRFDPWGTEIRIGEDFFLGEGERVRGGLLLVDGDAEIAGRIEGDAIVADGRLRLLPGGRIDGDVGLVDAELDREGGEIGGRIRDFDLREGTERGGDLSAIREEIREELRRELGDVRRGEWGAREEDSLRGSLRGLAGIFQTLLAGLLSLGIIWLVHHFAEDRLSTTVLALRTRPGKSFLVGLAGMVLFIPAYVLGAVALVISILGILLVPFWALLFPLVFALSIGGGTIVGVMGLGTWPPLERLPGAARIRLPGVMRAAALGLVGLLLFPLLENVAQMTGPFLGILRIPLAILGGIVFFATTTAGLGALILTRWGSPRGWHRGPRRRPPEEDWFPAATRPPVPAPGGGTTEPPAATGPSPRAGEEGDPTGSSGSSGWTGPSSPDRGPEAARPGEGAEPGDREESAAGAEPAGRPEEPTDASGPAKERGSDDA